MVVRQFHMSPMSRAQNALMLASAPPKFEKIRTGFGTYWSQHFLVFQQIVLDAFRMDFRIIALPDLKVAWDFRTQPGPKDTTSTGVDISNQFVWYSLSQTPGSFELDCWSHRCSNWW